MKDEDLHELTTRIHQELEEIQRVLARMHEGWDRARRTNDDYYLDGVALNLHGFYSGIERIFAQIAETIDDQVPRGENWHQVLLQQMTDEVTNVRPAVISMETGKRLNEHRGFRHIVRNVYTYNLDADKMGKLVLSAKDLFGQLKAEITGFVTFLESE